MKKKQPSLRRRLMQLVGGGLIALLMAQYAATVMELDERQEEMIDAVLDEQMHYTLELYHESGQVLKPNVPRLFFYNFPVGHPGPDVPDAFHSFGPGTHEVDIGETEFHFVVHDENGQRFVLAHDVEKFEQGFTQLMVALGITILLSAGLAIFCIYWLSGRVLANLTDLANAVHDQDNTPLSRPEMEAEVLALAEALDDYRTRQSLLLARERDFSGHLSHELRTPLSAVRGQAELLALQHPGDAGLQQRTQDIIAQADRMRALIEQMLHMARRTLTPARSAVPLRELIERLWRDLSEEGRSRTQLANRVPTDATVQADPLLLELILRNALANARRHADGAELRLDFDGQCLRIEDFDAEHKTLPDLPDDCSQGLGLSILQRACKLMGWSCEITALPTGMRLNISLPEK